jgi:NADPH:quinone reductase-like Zn-dependent oxidoreductase
MSDVAKPAPKDNGVLIRVRATTVTVADVRSRAFDVPASFWVPARITLGMLGPRRTILGAELAGDVEAVGQGVARFKAGDAVFASTVGTFGGYAEYICLPEDGTIALKPSNLTYEEAAALPVGARTALHYLRKADVQPCQKVLVYGASGSVGSYAVQLAAHLGADVTGVCSARNLELVRSLGAERVIDYTTEDFTKDGAIYDVVFVAVDKGSFDTCLKVLKPGGIYLNVTVPLPSPRMLWKSRAAGVRMALGENPTAGPDLLIAVRDLAEAGHLRPVIDRCYPLDDIVEAHRYVDRGHKRGNVAITVAQLGQA